MLEEPAEDPRVDRRDAVFSVEVDFGVVRLLASGFADGPRGGSPFGAIWLMTHRDVCACWRPAWVRYTTDPIVSAVLSVLSCKARQIGGIAGNVEADEVLYVVVSALFRFIDRETVLRARGSCPIRVDYRVPSHHAMQKDEIVECVIHDARPSRAQLTLESAGFQLVHRSSAVRDWFDSDEVIRVYYEECNRSREN